MIPSSARMRAPRALRLVAPLLGLLLVAAAAEASRVTDLRVGVHDEYTRIVLETDAAVTPQIRQGAREIIVRLGAESAPRAVAAARSPRVESVRVVPVRDGSELRIRLREPARLEHFTLDGPPRLVLDLREGAAAAEAPAASASPEAEAEGGGAPSAGAAPEAGDGDAEPANAADPELAESEWDAAEGAPSGPGAGAAEARELLEGGRIAGGSEPPSPAAGSGAEAAQPAGESAPGRTARAAGEPALPPPPSERGGALGFLPSPFDQPVTLAILAAVLLGLFVLSRMRGRRAEAESLSPFGAEEAGEAGEADGAAPADPAGAEAPGSAAAADPPADEEDDPYPAPASAPSSGANGGTAQPSIFDTPAPAEEPAAPPPTSGASEDAPGISAGPGGAPAPAGGGSGEELERRLAHLEQRLEELVDEKERLERQVAAQTEELRVQRAAIARTQRVLRGMSRSEDEASEPVPR